MSRAFSVALLDIVSPKRAAFPRCPGRTSWLRRNLPDHSKFPEFPSRWRRRRLRRGPLRWGADSHRLYGRRSGTLLIIPVAAVQGKSGWFARFVLEGPLMAYV